MSVEEQTPYNQYIGNGVTTVFAYQFQILDQNDLAVYVDSVLKVLGTDYAISGVGSSTGGQVTLTVAPGNGADVLLFRSMTLERDADYQTNGDLREVVLDRDFNRLWMVIQGQQANIRGTLRLPFPEEADPLPSPSVRAGGLLGFGSTGLPTIYPGVQDILDSVDRAEAAADTAEAAADVAVQAKDDAVAAASSIGPLKFYDTYAKALADIANVPVDGLVEIARDETRAGARTRYFKRVGNVFEFAVNLDQLRLDLDAAGGAALVNGDYVTVQRTLDGIKNDFDLSWLITKDGNKVVVTGDSLSFNVYDFAGGSPDNEAESCWPGLMSWSFMLRDMIHRADPWFVHADMLDFTEFNGYGFNVWNQASAYLLPFNNRYVAIGGDSATSEVSFLMPSENQQTGKLVLHCANNPNSDNGLMDVYYSLHPYTTRTLVGTLASGGRTKYQGWQPFQFDIPCGNSTAYPVKVTFTNFRNSDGSVPSSHRRLFLQGVGTKNTPVYLTGHGGWKASDIYADFNNRIGQYAPDLLVMILGANDRFYTTKEDYATNLVNIINATKLIKPYCKIVVLTALRASDPGYAPDEVLHGSTMREFLGFAKSAVLDAGGIWFDSYAFTSGINPAVWRFDNVHMTKRGNKMLFDALVGHFFNAAPKNLQYYDPSLQSTSSDQIVFKDGLPSIHGVVQVTYDNANTRYNITGGSDKSIVVRHVTRVNAYTVRFTFNYNIFAQFAHDSRITPPTLVHTGSSSLAVMPRINTITSNSVDLYLIDVISGAVLTDAQNDGQVYSLLF